MRTSGRKVRGEGILPSIAEEVEGATGLTSYAGAPLIAEVFGACGAAEAARRRVRTRERYRERGLSGEERFSLLLALGGECPEDFRQAGAGTMPCGRFGANAAWFRLNVLTYNLLSLLRQTALPQDLSKAKPKRLRFRALCVAGEVIHHARSVLVRVTGTLIGDEGLRARARLALRRLVLQAARMNAPPAAAA